MPTQAPIGQGLTARPGLNMRSRPPSAGAGADSAAPNGDISGNDQISPEVMCENIHKNARGDGRCSLFASADILDVTISELVTQFEGYALGLIKELDGRASLTVTSSPVVSFIAKERSSGICNLSDAVLHERWAMRQHAQIKDLHFLLQETHRLNQDPSCWQQNIAAAGSEVYNEFITWSFNQRGIPGVRSCSIEVDNYEACTTYLTHNDLKELLTQHSANLNNQQIATSFARQRLVVFLHVGGSHWHSITPLRLLRKKGMPDKIRRNCVEPGTSVDEELDAEEAIILETETRPINNAHAPPIQPPSPRQRPPTRETDPKRKKYMVNAQEKHLEENK